MQRSASIYATGTISGTIGTEIITGVGTSWLITDASGNQAANVAALDELWVGQNRTLLIASVDSPTQITLGEPLPFGIAPGTAYQIIRRTPVASSAVSGLMQLLSGQGTDAVPDAYRTFDNGVSRLRIGFSAGGLIQIQVRASSAADIAFVTAIQIDPATGACTFGNGTSAGSIASFNTLRATVGRPGNLIGIPGDFAIDALAKVLYGPKTLTSWPPGISLEGPKGDPGTTITLDQVQTMVAAQVAQQVAAQAAAQAADTLNRSLILTGVL
jgi:hypothetical protein